MSSTTHKMAQKLPENWQEEMLELYEVGASDTEVMYRMKIHHRLFKKFMTDPEFAEVIEFGRMASKAWWESQGRLNLTNKEFNSALYKIQVQARLGWSDKTSTHEADDGFEKALTVDQIDQQIEEKIGKLRPVEREKVVGG